MANETLRKAKAKKDDEYFTQRVDIESELCHYAKHFEGKVVYCNCDDPKDSEFVRFFTRNMIAWGIKKIIATHYDPDETVFTYKLEYTPDENGQFNMWGEPVITPLSCNGDFRSLECVELLKEADIVVTNPPFSLWHDYLSQLIEYKKKFLIIGNKNAVTYKDTFPLLMSGEMWVGHRSMNSDFWFVVPEGHKYEKTVNGKNMRHIMGVWYTNLDIEKRHMDLEVRGNYYDPDKHVQIDNFDAICVDNVDDIPGDYDGVMAVPITFFGKHNPAQFEILGISKTWFGGATKKYPKQIQVDKNGKRSEVTKLNDGAAVEVPGPVSGKTYYIVDGKYYIQKYARIFIRKVRNGN